MIVVDASVWIDHFRNPNQTLVALLRSRQIYAHPVVIGELALGQIPDREKALGELHELRQAVVADHEATFSLIEGQRLWGLGIGYSDAVLLASTLLTRGALLWTRDKRLRSVAETLGVAARIGS